MHAYLPPQGGEYNGGTTLQRQLSRAGQETNFAGEMAVNLTLSELE